MQTADERDSLKKHDVNGLGNFSRQWVLLRDSDRFDLDWVVRRVTPSTILYTHPALDVVSIDDEFRLGSKLLVLGIALFADQPDDDFVAVLKSKLRSSNGDIAAGVIQMSGTYVVVHCFGDEVELYTDPGGLRGVYYKDGRAASTPQLLPYIERDDNLDHVFPFGKPDEWYPGDLCPYVGTKALLANHRLMLGEGRIERFWPTGFLPSLDVERASEAAAALMRGAVRSAVKRWKVICSITGGKDTRVCLAASRPVADHIEFFTIRSPRTHPCDMNYPDMLASTFRLNHRFVDTTVAGLELLERYDLQTGGMSVGERREIIGACHQLAGRNVVHLNGNLGAMIKAYYWHRRHPSSIRKSSLLREFVHKPRALRDAVDRWFDTLPDLDARTAYNLMYLENRGRWASMSETGSQLFYDSLTPFNNRQVFELLSAVSSRSLAGVTLHERLVRQMWPGLLEVPYCRGSRRWSKLIPMSQRAFLKAAARRFGSIVSQNTAEEGCRK